MEQEESVDEDPLAVSTAKLPTKKKAGGKKASTAAAAKKGR